MVCCQCTQGKTYFLCLSMSTLYHSPTALSQRLCLCRFNVLGPNCWERRLVHWCLSIVRIELLQDVHDYRLLADDLVGSAKRWQEWMDLQRPEEESLPGMPFSHWSISRFQFSCAFKLYLSDLSLFLAHCITWFVNAIGATYFQVILLRITTSCFR